MIWPECACVAAAASLTTLSILNECFSVTVCYPFTPWPRLRAPLSINANVIESGCCEGIISNAIMLSLLAIASPKRIREISDRPNWKITAKGVGGQRFTHAAIFYCFFAQWSWFNLILAAGEFTEIICDFFKFGDFRILKGQNVTYGQNFHSVYSKLEPVICKETTVLIWSQNV